jgi:hypothetical protein
VLQVAREGAVAVESGDLVFVLDGEQPEIAARDREGERSVGPIDAALGGAHALDQSDKALGVGRVLVGGQRIGIALDQRVEACPVGVGVGG